MEYNIIDLIATLIFIFLLINKQIASTFICFIIYCFYIKNEERKIKPTFRKRRQKNRNFLKTLHVKNNSSIDCGIIVFNNKTKSSRFFQFDPRISEIHSVLKI